MECCKQRVMHDSDEGSEEQNAGRTVGRKAVLIRNPLEIRQECVCLHCSKESACILSVP
jgi:hypothetical protein